MEARGVGALDASAASKLRDALLLAAAEVHADAGVVLATSPDASSALQHAWLRACPIVDGADLETHVAVALFWGLHRDERRAASATAGGYDAAERRDDAVGRNGARAKDVAVTSSFGTVRRLTALELAAAVCDAISPDARKSTLVDARPAPGDSGVIHITTRAHYEARRGAGQLRCSTCGRFVAGDRALWWHQKTRHRVHHSEAVDAVEDELRALSTTVVGSALDAGFEPSTRGSATDASTPPGRTARSADDLAAGLAGGGEALDALIASGKVEALPDPGLEAARRGDVDALRRLVKDEGWDANAAVDRHGSGALLWAAGAGRLDAVKFLVEEAGTDPATTSQAGRRAYAGRTALHWAARNGHVHVMEYLVISRGVDVDARTAEGTTAFAWACWRGRVDAMRWLVEKGECRFGAVNTFGCNAAMWVVQGGAGLDACRYVRSLGVTFRLLNANGHSAVHKAAQRGRRDVCAWLLGRGGADGDDGDADAIVESDAPESDAEAAWARALVGSAHLAPDNEGFTPADHARLAGDARLATWLRARQREASVRECTRFIRNDGRNDGQNDETLAAVADESRGNDSVDRRVRDASGVETTYPPATFYGAAAVGDVHLLEEILDTDPYHVNQDNGTGAPLHFAVTYGRVDAVRELLAGGTRAAVNVNQRSKAGGFGLTPLHLAATLFRKRRVAAAARADLAAAEAELASEASVDLTGAKEEVIKAFTKEEVKAAKAAEKAARKAAHQRAAAARKVLATHGCGAEEARRMYRLLLQSGADPRAVATVPGPGASTVRVVPADLAGDDDDAAAEIAALESEATESVPEPFPRVDAGDWSADLARPVARSNAAYDVDSSLESRRSTNDDAAAEVGADDRAFPEVDAAAVDPRDADRVEALFCAAAREAGSAGEVPLARGRAGGSR